MASAMTRSCAWIGIEILDQPRRGIGVEMIDGLGVDDADLVFLDEGRHRNDEGEFTGLALVVARHGDRGLLAVARENDLGGFVEQLGVGLGDVEAAERARRSRRDGELRDDRGERDTGLQPGQQWALHREAPCGDPCEAFGRNDPVEQKRERRERNQRHIERRPHLHEEREIVRQRRHAPRQTASGRGANPAPFADRRS